MRAVRLLGGSGFQSMTERAELAEGASLYTSFLGAGGADSRIDVRSELAGEGAFAEIGGALLARGKQRHDANVVLRHASPEGMSRQTRSEEHTSELQSLMRKSYAVFCLKKKTKQQHYVNT